jgi:hypothetical protein
MDYVYDVDHRDESLPSGSQRELEQLIRAPRVDLRLLAVYLRSSVQTESSPAISIFPAGSPQNAIMDRT